MTLATIAAGVPFLPALAGVWSARLAGPGALNDGLILLPTRRAARELAAAFLRGAGQRPVLLPRIVALGGIDETPLAMAGALVLPPPIAEPDRLAGLARLILALAGAAGAPTRADRAWVLAGELAALMDEAERAEVDLAAALAKAADPGYALHWETTLRFLRIVTQAWPAHLAEKGLMNPAARQIALLDAQGAAWERAPPAHGVLAVGNVGDIPAIGRLLKVIAAMPNGMVVLPGLDMAMPQAAWEAVDACHPQAGLCQLLRQLGAERGDVAVIGGARVCPAERAALLSRALLPSAALSAWREPFRVDTSGICIIAPADPQAEAVAIAMILRNALEEPGVQAALVTPDRVLAARVSAELLRFGVVADDSAGEPLAQTPPAVLLRLLAAAVNDKLAPVALLGLLKHPLAAVGLPPAECRRAARLLEQFYIRGPLPGPGLAGLRQAIDQAGGQTRPRPITAEAADAVRDLLARLEQAIAPLLRGTAAVRTTPALLMATLIESAEALAATDTEAGPARLWAMEEGEALAERLTAVQAALPALPEQPPDCLPGLLDAVLAGAVVRTRRALRGGHDSEHPRVSIWGLLEARLQSADVMVLGGLAEGVWPAATDPGPWMSREMRKRAKLPNPDIPIGQAAHDFASSVCAAPVVVLSCPTRREGALAVPSRWLARLNALLAGQATALAAHPACAWARALDQPDGAPRPAGPPRPCPPLALRPRRLSVTEMGTLLADPYAIYARHILRLRKLEPLEQPADAQEYGELVHAGLHRFVAECGLDWPADAAPRLAARLHLALRAAGVREALMAWWSPRLSRIAEWVDAQERIRRAEQPPAAIATEIDGQWALARPHGPFVLTGRADRLERRADGTLSVFDYKTGQVPSARDVSSGLQPQLPLEAAMARAGGFGALYAAPAGALIYWKLSGGHKPGESRSLFGKSQDTLLAEVDRAAASLVTLVDHYATAGSAYLSQPHPGRRARFSDYKQLARVAEWDSAEEGEDGDDAEPESGDV